MLSAITKLRKLFGQSNLAHNIARAGQKEIFVTGIRGEEDACSFLMYEHDGLLPIKFYAMRLTNVLQLTHL